MKVVFDTNVLVSALVFPGGADAIITGDKAFLSLGSFRDVKLLSLRAYLEGNPDP